MEGAGEGAGPQLFPRFTFEQTKPHLLGDGAIGLFFLTTGMQGTGDVHEDIDTSVQTCIYMQREHTQIYVF